MAGLHVERISTKRTIDLASLNQVGNRFLRPEILSFATRVALEEAREQVRIGNPPSRVVIDRRTTINLSPADAKALVRQGNNVKFIGLDRKIQFFFTDNGILAQALTYAWTLLMSLTSVGKHAPHAINTYFIWCSDPNNKSRSRVAKNLDDAVRWISESSGGVVNVRILGPTAEYRRQLIYNPKGRKQQTRWTSMSNATTKKPSRAIDRYRFTKPTKSKVNDGKTSNIAIRSIKKRGRTYYQAQVSKAIQQIVVQNVKRQWRDMWVRYSFKPAKDLPLPLLNSPRWRPKNNVHIPEIALGVKYQYGR